MSGSDKKPPSGIAARAAERLPDLLGQPGFRTGGTLAPITITPARLAGNAPVFWTTRLFGVEELSISPTDLVSGQITLSADRGRLIVSLDGVQGYAFYVECVGRAPDPDKALRWDALVLEAGPVHGRMSRAPGNAVQYFATPYADRTGLSYCTIDAMTGDSWPQDDRWLINEVTILGFLPGSA